MKKNRQLKFEDRVKLELFIKEDVPVSQISKKLSISKQTIYREIQRNCIVKKWNVFGRIKCANFNECSYRI
jgi:IS30 family transposase